MGDLIPLVPGQLWSQWAEAAEMEVDRVWAALSAQFGSTAQVSDVLWRFYTERGLQAEPNLTVGYTRFRMGQLLAVERRFDGAAQMLLEALYAEVAGGFSRGSSKAHREEAMSAWLEGRRSFPSAWVHLLHEVMEHLDLTHKDLKSRFDLATAGWAGVPWAFPPSEAWRFVHWGLSAARR